MKTAHTREKEALSRILASGAFSRAPNLERILVYLCEKSFSGEGGHVKEFHLATEVLGRPATFDPKKDSIVRVEIHRLRKRLKDYYDKTPDEAVRILLPEKSYLPEFQVVDPVQRLDHDPLDPQVVAPDPLHQLGVVLALHQDPGGPGDPGATATDRDRAARGPGRGGRAQRAHRHQPDRAAVQPESGAERERAAAAVPVLEHDQVQATALLGP